MKKEITGLVFDIKRFAIHDGPGIRTTVFLKGCPLSCLWCHNPESQNKAQEIFFIPGKCIGCMYCVKVCPHGCHYIKNNRHIYDRQNCTNCGLCTEQCYSQALTIMGQKMTVDEVIKEVLKDRDFYTASKGGMTVSGGEPMVQFKFTKRLLESARKNNLHTCLDTSGFAPFQHYKELLDLVDIFLYDLKETDTEKHKQTTGVPYDSIIENLYKIDKNCGKIILRCLIIPGFNNRQDHFKKIADIANQLKNIIKIDLLPYHPLGKSKNAAIGKKYSLNKLSFSKENTVKKWQKCIQKFTKVPVG